MIGSLGGCAHRNTGKNPVKKDDDVLRRTVASGSGSSSEYSRDGKHRKLYTLIWQSGTATGTDVAHAYIEAGQVSGLIYKDGQPSSTFEASHGTADKSTGTLTLTGSVVLKMVGKKSAMGNAVLRCDALTYSTKDEILKARDNVNVTGPDYGMGPLPELWCTSDFNVIGTPDMFPATRHNDPQTPKR